MRKIISILMISIFSVLNTANSQTPRDELKHLKFESITEGISNNHITGILEDDRGYIWFATNRGLNRFDGLHFTIYENDPTDETSLSQNSLTTLVLDSKNRLWVGTRSAGLNLYNRDYDNFTRFEHSDDSTSLSHNSVRSLFEDNNQNLWIGTKGGLNMYDSGSFVKYSHDDNDPSSLSNNNVRVMLEDSFGNFWLGTDAGLDRFDLDRGVFELMTPASINPRHDRTSCIYEDEFGNIWYGGPWGGGLRYLEKDNKSYTSKVLLPEGSGFLDSSREDILSISRGTHGNIWIGTENGGLQILNPKTLESTYLVRDAKDKYSIPSNSIWSICHDQNDKMWIGTYNNGIKLYDPKKKKFDHHLVLEQSRAEEGNNSVSCIAKVGNELLVGTDGGGLYVLNRSYEVVDHYLNMDGENNSPSSNAILDLEVDQNGIVWIGTYGGGLNRYDRKTNLFTIYKQEGQKHASLTDNDIFSVKMDQFGDLWVGSWGGGVYHFDTKEEVFRPIEYVDQDKSNNPKDPVYISNINCLFFDKNKNLWLSSMYGLFRGRFVSRMHYEFDEIRIEKDKPLEALSIFEDKKGKIWIGTENEGLIKLDADPLILDERDGLAGNTVNYITQDLEGHLWISTNKGLSKFDIKKGTFDNYEKSDGLQDNEFVRRSGLTLENGEVHLGGINGFNTFLPLEITDNDVIPPVYITNLKIFNKEVPIATKDSPLSKSISELTEISLSYEHSVFSIDFQAISFTQPEKTMYAYKLDGFETEWNYVGDKRSATYTNLDPGTYVFHVKAANNDGLWNEQGARLTINILPPWWETWWAYTGFIIFILMLVYLIVSIRTKYLQSQRKQLQKIVEERTEELRGKNEKIRIQTVELKAFNDALNDLNKDLNHVNENLENTIQKRTNELTYKNRRLAEYAFINAHNLRVPVANIKGIIQLFSKSKSNEELIELSIMLKKQSDDLDNVLYEIRDLLEKDGYDFHIENEKIVENEESNTSKNS